MPINKKKMAKLKKQYGEKGKDVYYALEQKEKKKKKQKEKKKKKKK